MRVVIIDWRCALCSHMLAVLHVECRDRNSDERSFGFSRRLRSPTWLEEQEGCSITRIVMGSYDMMWCKICTSELTHKLSV